MPQACRPVFQKFFSAVFPLRDGPVGCQPAEPYYPPNFLLFINTNQNQCRNPSTPSLSRRSLPLFVSVFSFLFLFWIPFHFLAFTHSFCSEGGRSR